MADADQSNARRSDPVDENVSGNEDVKKPARQSNIKYITRQTANDWTAEALMGEQWKMRRETIWEKSIM